MATENAPGQAKKEPATKLSAPNYSGHATACQYRTSTAAKPCTCPPPAPVPR